MGGRGALSWRNRSQKDRNLLCRIPWGQCNIKLIQSVVVWEEKLASSFREPSEMVFLQLLRFWLLQPPRPGGWTPSPHCKQSGFHAEANLKCRTGVAPPGLLLQKDVSPFPQENSLRGLEGPIWIYVIRWMG
ncbi:uncharacterized protein ACIBXB_000730 [Morphnus guianensis]